MQELIEPRESQSLFETFWEDLDVAAKNPSKVAAQQAWMAASRIASNRCKDAIAQAVEAVKSTQPATTPPPPVESNGKLTIAADDTCEFARSDGTTKTTFSLVEMKFFLEKIEMTTEDELKKETNESDPAYNTKHAHRVVEEIVSTITESFPQFTAMTPGEAYRLWNGTWSQFNSWQKKTTPEVFASGQ